MELCFEGLMHIRWRMIDVGKVTNIYLHPTDIYMKHIRNKELHSTQSMTSFMFCM